MFKVVFFLLLLFPFSPSSIPASLASSSSRFGCRARSVVPLVLPVSVLTHHLSFPSATTLFSIRSSGSRPVLGISGSKSSHVEGILSSYLEAFTSVASQDLITRSYLESVPFRAIIVLTRLSELSKHNLRFTTATRSMFTLKRMVTTLLKTGPPLSFCLTPAEHIFHSGVTLEVISHGPQFNRISTSKIFQTPHSTVRSVITSDFALVFTDGAHLLSLGQHWYSLGFMGFMGLFWCFRHVFRLRLGKVIMGILMVPLDSPFKLIRILVGIYLGPYLFADWWVRRLDLFLGGLVYKTNMLVLTHRSKSGFIYAEIMPQVYQTTSLSDDYSRSRESSILVRLMRRLVIPERCSIVRRFFSALEKAKSLPLREVSTAFKRVFRLLKAASPWSTFGKCAIIRNHLDPIEEYISMPFEDLSLYLQFINVCRFAFYLVDLRFEDAVKLIVDSCNRTI